MKKILVTGATGYIGGKLIPKLVEKEYDVRCMVRNEKRLRSKKWYGQVDIIEADVFDPGGLHRALEGVDAAYYLIHSMSAGDNFHEADLIAARNFGTAAREMGVKQLIYLGGLGNPESNLSVHLRSRQDTGRALREAGVPVTEFRAAVIVGSGSLSFEMIRYLTERVPLMICPKWVYTRTQPIAIGDVLNYLVGSLGKKECLDQIIEIGGRDVITYRQMITGYAQARHLKRFLIPVPVLTPRLSSYWVHLVTPITGSIARPLIDGLKNEVIVTDNIAKELFPQMPLQSYRNAVTEALETSNPETYCEDSENTDIRDYTVNHRSGMIIERYRMKFKTDPKKLFDSFASLGGQTGWLYMNRLWKIRGRLDKWIGGVGMRPGRKDSERIKPGDHMDFWTVQTVNPGKSLLLRSEMKLPGEVWLGWDTMPSAPDTTVLAQTIYFIPRGLVGILYWYVSYPLHVLVFRGLVKSIGIRSESP